MNDEQNFTSGSIPKKLLAFMLPILFALIMQAMYSAVDFLIVGQSFLIRLPMSYIMSIQPDATLTGIGAAAPTATVFGILLCVIYYIHTNRKLVKSKGMLYD